MPQTFVSAKVLLFPPTAISRRLSSGFTVSDTLASMTGSGLSDGNGGTSDPLSELNPTIAQAWAQNPYTLSIDGCDFARFTPEGRVYFGASFPRNAKAELAGFFVSPRYAALDSKIGANAGSVDSGKTDINWTAVKGTWRSLAALDSDSGTGIQNSGNDTFAMASTTGSLPANRGFRMRLEFSVLPQQSALPSVRIRWGEKWALRMPHGKVPRLERLVAVTTTVDNLPVTVNQWQLVKELAGVKPVNIRGGKAQVFVFRMAGRLVVSFNGSGFWFLDTGSQAKPAKPREAVWGDAPVWLEAAGARITRADMATIKWCAPDGTKYGGTVERVIPRQSQLDDSSEGTGACGGWKRAGTSAGVAVSLVDDGVKYRLELLANEDGIDSPFVDKVSGRFEPQWLNPTPSPFDARFATRAIGISLEMGPQITGSEATIELDRAQLDAFGGDWERFARMDNPVEIHLKRCGSDYAKVFSGYIFKPEKTSNASGARILKLTCRDAMVRLQKVGAVYNSIVDHRCMALDLLFAEQLQASFSNGGYESDGTPAPAYNGLYYGDCIKALVTLFLGQEEAARINGDGNVKKYYGRDHPPILSPNNDIGGWLQLAALTGEPIAAGGFLLPPPYWDDPYSWMANDIAKRDKCVLFYGWPPGYEGDKPCLIYGRLQRILRAQGLRLHTLRDVAVSGSREDLLSMVSVERRPERTFNRVVVSGPQEPGLEGLRPSLRVEEFNLPNYEGDAAWRSWEKTYLVRDPLAFLGAQAIGQGIIQQMQGVNLQWPTFDVDGGDERIHVGHLVKVDFTGVFADDGLEIGEQVFRAESVSHQCTFTENSGTMTTSIRPRPLTAVEERSYQHVVNVGGVVETEPFVDVDLELPS